MLTDVRPAPDFISEPTSAAELGLDRGILIDLALKSLFYRGRMTRMELADALCIAGSATQELLQALSQDNLSHVLGSEGGSGPSHYVHALTQKGLDRAEEAFARSGYVGAAPVPLAQYIKQVEAQAIGDAAVSPEQVRAVLGDLVMPEETIMRVGRAASSRRSTLIHGPSGNGKSTVARALGHALSGSILIPHALEIAGHVVHLYDPSKHDIIPEAVSHGRASILNSRFDRRWVRIARPVVWAGGELTRDSLELMHDDSTRIYEAPLQLKANGGTLIIDDFGRQQMPAVELLNRWIGALEGGIDHLTMHTGQTVAVPFDVLVLFSTNLAPTALADDAFLRRIRYKIELQNPSRKEFLAIFERECERQGVAWSAPTASYLIERWYLTQGRELRGCHPRDLCDAIVDASRYEGTEPVLSAEALEEACATYFLQPAAPATES